MFAGYLFLRFKDGRGIHQINPSQTILNLQYLAVDQLTIDLSRGSVVKTSLSDN